MTTRPGRPFWSAFTAFFSNMAGLFVVDQITFTAQDIAVMNWWVALIASAFVAGAVYGKDKIAEARANNHNDLT